MSSADTLHKSCFSSQLTFYRVWLSYDGIVMLIWLCGKEQCCSGTLWLVPCSIVNCHSSPLRQKWPRDSLQYCIVSRRQFSALPRCAISYKEENIVVIYQKRRNGNLSNWTLNTSAYVRWKYWPAKMLICSCTIRLAVTESQRMSAEASVLLSM